MMNYNIKPSPIVQEYTTLGDGERLYDDVEFYGTTKIVEAKYVRSITFPGNALVEALPVPRSLQEIVLACQKENLAFDYNTVVQEPTSRKLQHIIALRSLHYVLPMQQQLENGFYMALTNSYAHRAFLESRAGSSPITVQDTEHSINRSLLGDPADGAFGGFSLIGKSGCGNPPRSETSFGIIPR